MSALIKLYDMAFQEQALLLKEAREAECEIARIRLEERATGMGIQAARIMDLLEEEGLKECADCGKWHEFDDDFRNEDGQHICDGCYSELEDCPECGGKYHESEMVQLSYDEPVNRVCENCEPRELGA